MNDLTLRIAEQIISVFKNHREVMQQLGKTMLAWELLADLKANIKFTRTKLID